MGTNYYIHTESCKLCGHEKEGIHLGKSSFGWSFALQANRFTEYKNWEEMKAWLKDKTIEDEYGHKITLTEFISMVESKKDVKDPETEWGSHGPILIDGYKFFDHKFS